MENIAVPLDETDKRILSLLQEDATLTHKQIAFELNLTVTPIFERVKKLRKAGVISGIHAKVDRNKVGKPLLVLCEVSVQNHKKDHLERFEKEILNLSEVVSCYHVSGKHDYMLKIVTTGMDDYRNFLVNKLAKISGVGQVNSSFVMKDLKSTESIPL